MGSVVQIPFSAFKAIGVGQSVALSLYQNLYDDNTEPVGISAIIQALGIIKPCDEAISRFNQRWTRGSMKWTMKETGIEFVTGKSSTSAELAKTAEGEATLMLLSFLLDSMQREEVTKFAMRVVNTTPDSLLQIKPRRAQIASIVTAVNNQTASVSWQTEIEEAQKAVFEYPKLWHPNDILSHDSFDLNTEALAAYYQALCTITRFPNDYRCILETGCSLTQPFVLAHSICGLRVCVVVDGDVVHGNPSTKMWHVRLERKTDGPYITKVKIGKSLEDVQDVIVVGKVGIQRGNRVSVEGIGYATTAQQGLEPDEAEDLAALAIGITISTISKWKREVFVYDDSDDDSSASDSDSSSSRQQADANQTIQQTVPVKTRLRPDAIELWWKCSSQIAFKLLRSGQKALERQIPTASWSQLRFSNKTTAKIVEFEQLSKGDQMKKRGQVSHPLSRDDYRRLVHTLVSQLILISFLENREGQNCGVRVRSSSRPHVTYVGKAIKCMKEPSKLGQYHVMSSWYHWMEGSPPRDIDRVEVYMADGFLIYRPLMLDISLRPEAVEAVIIEPGHLVFGSLRPKILLGCESGYSIVGEPHYKQRLEGPQKLRSKNMTGPVKVIWHVDEVGGILELSLSLIVEQSGVRIDTSVAQIAQQCWHLFYGDASIGCSHTEERVGSLLDGENVQEITPGAHSDRSMSSWEPIELFRAYENELGQVASLLSIEKESGCLIKQLACLRCCITYAEKYGLSYVID
jgi:hypothetical protein